MIFVDETRSAALATHEMAYGAIREALIATVRKDAISFPVVIGHASDAQNRFTIKSASNRDIAGVKVGSYFLTNDRAGLPRHGSMILLFDQAIGRIGAIVEAGKLNAYRTAAADAVAAEALSRHDARVLTLFGTGHQAAYDAAAIARVRSIERLIVVGRSTEKTCAMVTRLKTLGLPAEAAQDPEEACRSADIIVTVTSACSALFDADWVTSGTHVASMGSDGKGKQELPTELYQRAKLFCDLPEQARVVGEFQHAPADAGVTAIGQVLIGSALGRTDRSDITVFDSSGVSLQDLFMAEAILRAHFA
ncbi:MAG: ornithine cyclodeaminase family protein [Paracoccus sp.]|nr:MAG: ornithine cyclodeaminase family protein [Paracoccus sp. (in: a-proteobacteria)]